MAGMKELHKALIDARGLAELPAPVGAILDDMAVIDAAPRALADPRAPEDPLRRLVAGHDALTIARDQLAHEQAAAEQARARKVCSDARSGMRARLSDVVREHAEDIITGPVRAVISRAIDDARPLADTLRTYAPDFDGAHIAEHGTAEQVTAYQQWRQLQAHADTMYDLWRAILPPRVAREHYPTHPGGEAVWERPELVPAEHRGIYLRREGTGSEDRIPATRSVLLIASVPAEAGYRLASLDELRRIHADYQAEEKATRTAQQRRPRAVFLT